MASRVCNGVARAGCHTDGQGVALVNGWTRASERGRVWRGETSELLATECKWRRVYKKRSRHSAETMRVSTKLCAERATCAPRPDRTARRTGTGDRGAAPVQCGI